MMLTHIIAIILAIILFLIPLLKSPNLKPQQWKLLLLVSIGMFWTFSEFVPSYFFFNNDILYILNKISFALSLAMFASLLYFIYDVVELKWNHFINYALGLIYILIIFLTAFTNFFIKGVELKTAGANINIPGVGYYAVLILMAGTIISLFIILLIKKQKKGLDERTKSIYTILFYTTSIPPLAGLAFNLLLPILNYNIPPIAHITYAITALGFIYAIYKDRAFGIDHVNIPIWTKIYFIVNSISVIVIFSGFFSYYLVAEDKIITDTGKTLHSIAQIKNNQINNHLEKLTETIDYISTNPEIINSVETGTEIPLLEIVSTGLTENWGIYDVLAIDSDGYIFWSSKSEEDLNTNIYSSIFLNENLTTSVKYTSETGKYKLSDFSYYKPSTKRISFLSYPVLKDGNTVGSIVIKLKDSHFNTLLEESTDELRTYLVQANGEIIFPFNEFSNENIKYTELEITHECTNSEISHAHSALDSHTYTNQQGNNVIAITSSIQNDWCLITETDEIIAMVDLNDLLFSFIYFSIIISIIVAISAYLLSKRITSPISKLSSELSHLDLTSVTKQLKVERKDEVGQLAKVFNDMTLRLKTAQVEVMRKVSKQTEEIGKTKTKLEQQQSAIMNILQDIEVEKEITATQRDRLDIILKSIGDGVFVVDNDLNVTMINQQASKISGYTVSEVINKPYQETLKFVNEATLEPVEQFINDAISKGETMNMPDKTLIITKSGEYIPVADSAAPLKNEAGDIMGCVIIFRDITSEKELDEMKTEFLSVAAHQLRTPLGSMRWNIEMLISEDIEKLSEPMKEILQQVYDSNQRMAILVDDLLNTSRIDQERIDDKPEETDVINIIKDAITEIKPIAKQKSINVLLQLEDSEYDKVLLDPKKFREVIQNLLSNAVKYNKDKGEVYVTVKKEVSIPCGLQISIKDTGMGIPKKDQQKLFRKFFRADNAIKSETEGSGLGLFVVKSYIEDWGGTITYESEENKGSTFNICLPNKPEETKLNINLKDKPQNNE